MSWKLTQKLQTEYKTYRTDTKCRYRTVASSKYLRNKIKYKHNPLLQYLYRRKKPRKTAIYFANHREQKLLCNIFLKNTKADSKQWDMKTGYCQRVCNTVLLFIHIFIRSPLPQTKSFYKSTSFSSNILSILFVDTAAD